MSGTPRTDNFVQVMPPMHLRPEDFSSIEAAIRIEHQIRDLMIAWATFARELERDLADADLPPRGGR